LNAEIFVRHTEREIRDRIVEVAMTWLNTPFVDQQGVKGVGVDCAYFPIRVCAEVGLIENFNPDYYSPQLMLHSDNDRTYIETVEKCGGHQIEESAVKPGDLVLYFVSRTYAHGGIVISWPDVVIHPLKNRGVVLSHGTNEGFFQRRKRLFFSVF
jgi:cell wall-associated NlpC family hydrolase